ncbi:hypothetical protein [Streptomyces sp. NPDC054834]
MRSALMRSDVNWAHRCARWLEESSDGPLHDARWKLAERQVFPPYVWTGDFMRAWPDRCLDWCAGGWEGVVPLRPLSPPDAPRVKAHRKYARDGTLAPVLLWWVTALAGWLLLDCHDRAVAALAEGTDPKCVVLNRVMDEEEWRWEPEGRLAEHEWLTARLLERSATEQHRRRVLRVSTTRSPACRTRVPARAPGRSPAAPPPGTPWPPP